MGTGYSEGQSSVGQKAKGSQPHGVLGSRIPWEPWFLTFGITDPFKKLVKTKDHSYRKPNVCILEGSRIPGISPRNFR